MRKSIIQLGVAGLLAAAGAFSFAATAAAQPRAAAQSVMEEPDSEGVTIPAKLRRQLVNYTTREAAGTIVVDTANT